MLGVRFAPTAVLFEIKLALHQFLVLASPVVYALALGALHFY